MVERKVSVEQPNCTGTESDLNEWGRAQLLAMRKTDTIVTRAMTGATVRCIRTPEILAYEEALARNADADEVCELKRRVARLAQRGTQG
jgi:NAD(P)H-dependent flavin oxidoreductase YrpB (nitropropane dioxygenase family)